MAEPVFSIITVIKNNAAGLRLTAKSIAYQQNAARYEWLIMDDGSAGNIAETISEFANEHTRIISAPYENRYDAMNNGIELAAGRYLWFVEAGNCLSDIYILRDVAKQIQYNLAPDLIYGDARENGRIKKANSAHRFVWGEITHPQSMVYRRGMVHELRFDPEYPLSGDYAFTLNVLARARKLSYYNRFLCDYVIPTPLLEDLQAIAQENYVVRHELLGMSSFKNKLILKMNQLTNSIKVKLPFVYRLSQISVR